MAGDNNRAWNDEATIRCRFSFICPKQWQRLKPTMEQDVRYCLECRRDVHLAKTDEAITQHQALGHCIAVPVVREGSAEDGETGWIVGNAGMGYG
ncbi:MAG: hypothetical protein KF814_01130 [Nitrospiraceae bacterium]|nr:hypothetical protein [Nitrospiraceae bacterium]